MCALIKSHTTLHSSTNKISAFIKNLHPTYSLVNNIPKNTIWLKGESHASTDVEVHADYEICAAKMYQAVSAPDSNRGTFVLWLGTGLGPEC